ncbi:14612_t:CDS:2, partial [Cetraspora pellucida]
VMKAFYISFIILSAIFPIYCFPEGRGGHESVQVNNKLYFMGGSRLIPNSNLKRYNLSDEVFYLDLSSQFDTENPPFVDLTNGTSRMFYGNEKGAAVLGGSNRSDIYLIGGTQLNFSMVNWNATDQINWNATDQFIYIYRTSANIWTKFEQGVKGIQPSRRRSTSTVIKPNGTIYIFGGRIEKDMASDNLTLYNELYEFDTILLSWIQIVADNAPSPRSHSTATLLQNGKIVYIGGVSQDKPGSQTNLIIMTEIRIFDTTFLSWSSHTANAPFPIQPRVGHTAVLAPDNNSIIIMGGTSSYQLMQTTVTPNLLKLDIRSEPYQYSILQTSGNNQPPTLSFHTANIYSDYMIVAFGNITNGATDSNETSSKVYLLYIPCLTWEYTFVPNRSDCKNKDENNHGLIIDIVIPIGCLIIIGAIILYCLYRRKNERCKDLDCFKIWHRNQNQTQNTKPVEQPTRTESLTGYADYVIHLAVHMQGVRPGHIGEININIMNTNTL